MYFVLAFTNTCIYASIIYIFAIIVVVEDCLVHISAQSVCESFPLFFDVHVVVVSDLIFLLDFFILFSCEGWYAVNAAKVGAEVVGEL